MISVIIPTYKPKEYINQCLQSLEAQTLDINLFEVIVVLNGEKEPYYSDIKQLLESCSFNNRLFHTDTAGVSNARNIGLDNAKGEYICFIDDDDYISIPYLENLYSKLIKNTQSIAVSNVNTFSEGGSVLGNDYISHTFNHLSKHPTNSIFKKRHFLSSSCCKLIPQSIIGNHRFNINHHLSEDALFMFEISYQIKDIILSDASTIYYRRLRPNSASRKPMSLYTRISHKTCFIIHITKIYIHHFTKFNFWLFISRIIAIIKFK